MNRKGWRPYSNPQWSESKKRTLERNTTTTLPELQRYTMGKANSQRDINMDRSQPFVMSFFFFPVPGLLLLLIFYLYTF